MKNITTTQMIAMLNETVKGTMFITALTETEPAMRKTGNMYYGKTFKKQNMNGQVGFDYSAGVNNLAAKEGKEARETHQRSWGKLSSNRIFIENDNGETTHLRMRVKNSTDIRYFVRENGNDTEIEKALIAPFLTQKHKSSTQEDLIGQVTERDIKLSNVKAIHFCHEEYIIQEPTTTLPAASETTEIPQEVTI